MKTWDEFIAWMDQFPKVTTHEVVCGEKRIVAAPVTIEVTDEESAKMYLMDQVTNRIKDKANVFVRVMPEVTVHSGRYMGYARIAIG